MSRVHRPKILNKINCFTCIASPAEIDKVIHESPFFPWSS
jgi:hypothetical protein